MTNWLDIGGGALLVLYAFALLVFDRYLSSRPSRDLLLAYLATLRDGAGHQLPSVLDAPAQFGTLVTKTNGEIEQAIVVVRGAHNGWFRQIIRPISVTRVLSMWREAHEIEEKAWALATCAELTNRLRTAASELGTFSKDGSAGAIAEGLSNRITKELDNPSSLTQPQPKLILKTRQWELQRMGAPVQQEPTSRDGLCALVQEAVNFLYDQRDTKFQSLASRQTQSVWLAAFGLALIVMASVTAHRQSLFVFGALGAFISRLGRVQSGVPKEDDYGVSSGSLYLSLPAGAIAGWVGVLALNALALPSIHVLSGSFQGMWDYPTHILPAALAVAFGFSERLLNRVLDQTANTVSGSSTKPTAVSKK